MTIAKFAENNNTTVKSVLVWIYKGLIPMASVDHDYVPDSARKPYSARAKDANGICVSIVRASVNREHVCARTYGICEDEFQGYICRLIEAHLIEKRVSDGVTYYDATLQAKQQAGRKIRQFVLDAIGKVSSGVSYGLAKAALDTFSAA